MQIRHPVKHFPELGAVPASEHTQIVELDHYEVFVTNKTAGRRTLSFMLTLALVFDSRRLLVARLRTWILRRFG